MGAVRWFDAWLTRRQSDEGVRVSFEHVQAEAGDSDDKDTLKACSRMRIRHGDAYYAELLFVLTRKRYPLADAKQLWLAIVAHRDGIREALGRNPGIVVAALDYLTNVSDQLPRAVLIEEGALCQMLRHATHDGMTDLYDHQTLEVLFEQFAAEKNDALSVIMVDLDHFKRFNDEHGHQAGDRVIRRVAQVLRDHVRDTDIAARYGGEEFCVVLRNKGPIEAGNIAERLRLAIAKALVADGVTASFGVASYPSHVDSPSDLISVADRALYISKTHGRNQVTLGLDEELIDVADEELVDLDCEEALEVRDSEIAASDSGTWRIGHERLSCVPPFVSLSN